MLEAKPGRKRTPGLFPAIFRYASRGKSGRDAYWMVLLCRTAALNNKSDRRRGGWMERDGAGDTRQNNNPTWLLHLDLHTPAGLWRKLRSVITSSSLIISVIIIITSSLRGTMHWKRREIGLSVV